MIGKHCGQRLLSKNENKFYFRKQCAVCRKVFKQRKRRAKAN